MIVISDATPINYLTLIGEVELLHKLYSQIIVPKSVISELLDFRAPKPVRKFAAALPSWVLVQSPAESSVPYKIDNLGQGERQAILIAMELAPAVVLTDDRAARRVAAMYSVSTISTLRVLADAAEAGEVSLEYAFLKLSSTNFRVNEDILQRFLREDAIRRGSLNL